jgi:ADP-ribose pyrophosphatase YjhB (NUDIX family)
MLREGAAATQVGVGGLVLDDAGQVLAVREAYRPTGWKLPGGLTNVGEDWGAAAEREVHEETGVDAAFRSVLALRHQHGVAFGRSDVYVICLLAARSTTLHVQASEVPLHALLHALFVTCATHGHDPTDRLARRGGCRWQSWNV